MRLVQPKKGKVTLLIVPSFEMHLDHKHRMIPFQLQKVFLPTVLAQSLLR